MFRLSYALVEKYRTLLCILRPEVFKGWVWQKLGRGIYINVSLVPCLEKRHSGVFDLNKKRLFT